MTTINTKTYRELVLPSKRWEPSLTAKTERDPLLPNIRAWSDPSLGFEQWSRAIRPSINAWHREDRFGCMIEIGNPLFHALTVE
jgi:hypothetical protein